MTVFQPGLVHTPVTPFKADQSIDYDVYAKILEWHVKNGAEALALPMPEGGREQLEQAYVAPRNAVADVRQRVNYEGQAAIELEWLAAAMAPDKIGRAHV